MREHLSHFTTVTKCIVSRVRHTIFKGQTILNISSNVSNTVGFPILDWLVQSPYLTRVYLSKIDYIHKDPGAEMYTADYIQYEATHNVYFCMYQGCDIPTSCKKSTAIHITKNNSTFCFAELTSTLICEYLSFVLKIGIQFSRYIAFNPSYNNTKAQGNRVGCFAMPWKMATSFMLQRINIGWKTRPNIDDNSACLKIVVWFKSV